VAVKVIDKAKLDPRTQKMLAREISNMDAVAHPNIIRYFGVISCRVSQKKSVLRNFKMLFYLMNLVVNFRNMCNIL